MDKNDRFYRPKTFLERISSIFGKGDIRGHIEDIEEVLIEADIDMSIVSKLLDFLEQGKYGSYEEAKDYLKQIFIEELQGGGPETVIKGKPHVIIMAGINGAGKTTAISKIAGFYMNKKKEVILVAADTFRAAAIEQLETWGERLDAKVVRGEEGADPASVAFDGVAKAKASGADIVIVDTAGRLHNKGNLMEELAKIKKVVLRAVDEERVETLLVIDANTGKNAFTQAKEFDAALSVSGVVLTKYDSSAKGGSIIQIKSGLDLPVRFVTFGESIEDIEEFNAERFVEELFE